MTDWISNHYTKNTANIYVLSFILRYFNSSTPTLNSIRSKNSTATIRILHFYFFFFGKLRQCAGFSRFAFLSLFSKYPPWIDLHAYNVFAECIWLCGDIEQRYEPNQWTNFNTVSKVKLIQFWMSRLHFTLFYIDSNSILYSSCSNIFRLSTIYVDAILQETLNFGAQ